MGILDSIKRAKRSREAKRQQELDALIDSGNGPATLNKNKSSNMYKKEPA